MAQKALANELYLEEFNRLDTELKQLQHELTDTVELNDELTKVIAQKEEELITKEKRLESLRDKNIADGEQLELELQMLVDKYDFELSSKEEIVRKLDLQHKRFYEIHKENDELRETIDKLQSLMESNRDEHALRMHEKNLEMKTLREVMEKKMRDQLNKMDISYQKEAFSALSERHKKAMFQNAKLKDEVALQGVGLNNLGSRLGKQSQQHDQCLKELRALNKRLKALKEHLSVIAAKKIEIARKKEEVLADEARLQKICADLRARLNTEPKTPTSIQLREELYTKIMNTKCDVIMWSKRLLQLQEIDMNLKPVYEYEELGRFNPKTFPLEASMSLHSTVVKSASRTRTSTAHSICSQLSEHTIRSAASNLGSRALSPTAAGAAAAAVLESRTPDNRSAFPGSPDSPLSPSADIVHYDNALVPMSIKPHELEELCEGDAQLAEALAPLRGKEAQLLTTLPGEGKQKNKNKSTSHPSTAAASAVGGEQAAEVAERDQNMIAWVTLKIVDIWEATRVDCERLKSEQYALLEKALDTLHSDAAMASFVITSSGPSTQQNSARTGKFKGLSVSVSNPDLPELIENAEEDKSLSPETSQHIGIGYEPEEEGEQGDREGQCTEDKTEGLDPILEFASADERETVASSVRDREETLSLLSDGAKVLQSFSSIPASVPVSSVEVPELSIQTEQLSAPLSPHTASVQRQQQRDWIESGELQEHDIHRLWDEAFASHPSGLQIDSPEKPVTTWLKKVAPAKRYPTSTVHMEGAPLYARTSAAAVEKKKMSHVLRLAAQLATSTDSFVSTEKPRDITSELLLKDIRQVDSSLEYRVCPPVSIPVSLQEGGGKGSAGMRHSVTLPHIPSASKLSERSVSYPNTPSHLSQSQEQLGMGAEYSGLELTEEGMVLKDPLMGKKFVQQRKALVAGAMKAAAKRAHEKLGAKSTPALHSVAGVSSNTGSQIGGDSSMQTKKHIHSMSSNFASGNGKPRK